MALFNFSNLHHYMGFTGITIYYFNTKVKVSQKSEMSEYVKSMGINEIPAILEVNKGRIVTVYDGQIDEKCREN